MKRRRAVRGILSIISWCLILFGIYLAVGPYVRDYLFTLKTRQIIDNFENNFAEDVRPESGTAVDTINLEEESQCKEKDVLYKNMLAYNQRIFEEGQSEITDRESFNSLPEELELIGEHPVGYVEIPSISVKLPLYVGATTENMGYGAAVLSNTSMPIGGENTNCVIAGHRGYYSSKYFKDIEEVAPGDSIFITNPWETLSYTVTGFDIIDPNDADKIRIKAGKDLVTLLTCHPYMSGGRYRYIVYCEPSDSDGSMAADAQKEVPDNNNKESAGLNADLKTATALEGLIEASDGTVFESSANTIRYEDCMRLAGAVLIVSVLAVKLIMAAVSHIKKIFRYPDFNFTDNGRL